MGEDQVLDTVMQVVRAAYVRAATGKPPPTVAQEECEGILAQHAEQLRADERMVAECVHQARLEGQYAVQSALHGHPVVDSEMLDEALQHALDGEGPET